MLGVLKRHWLKIIIVYSIFFSVSMPIFFWVPSPSNTFVHILLSIVAFSIVIMWARKSRNHEQWV
ncbi:hypothetical protein JCM19037_91 [Geomicrobium sp. JCM 19037]|nr:hypothetical protein JCM19037_91 [Geomicrobium sp. JCM 19037]